jgi:eukaryotic-like serine/threonine-protein kinase
MGLLEKDPAQRLEVQIARTMLRQQLAGPLASTSPPHLMTDPYSVVPSQRPPAAETQALPPQPNLPSGQIGGRAMLAPGDSLSGHLAKMRQGGGGRRRAKDKAQPGIDTTPGDPTGVLPPTGGHDATSVLPPAREAWNGARAAGTVHGGRGFAANALRAARETGNHLVTAVQGWPRNKQLAAGGAGLAVVVLLVLVSSLVGGGDEQPPRTRQPVAQAPVPVAAETQEYKDRGITVNVPKGWRRSASGNWVDYSDPKDAKRKVRILVESSNGTPTSFLSIAENTLKTRSTSCPKPFTRVGVTPTPIAGQDGAVLEYTCGTGTSARHGLWGAVVTDGKAYSFYLTTKESQFADSKPIFDEMLRTYALQSS